MSKNIYITEKQFNQLNESLKEQTLMNNLSCPAKMFEGYFSEKFLNNLLKKKYDKIVGMFDDDITTRSEEEIQNKISKVITRIQKKEEKIKPQLEKLCADTILNTFEIPEGAIEFSCNLVNRIESIGGVMVKPLDADDYEFQDFEEIEGFDSELLKRNIHNTLSEGCADWLYEKYSPMNEILQMDDELPHLYNLFKALNDYLILIKKNFDITDENPQQGGMVNVKLGNDIYKTKIKSEGIIFPILLQESFKGFIELFFSHGLPDDKDKMMSITNNTDVIENEPIYMKYGPQLWGNMINQVDDFDIQYLPNFIMDLGNLDSEQFLSLGHNVFYNTTKGKEEINEFYNKVKHDVGYDSFNQDMMKKQSDAQLIQDGYLDEEYFEK